MFHFALIRLGIDGFEKKKKQSSLVSQLREKVKKVKHDNMSNTCN